jgi:hypothetical protein
MQTIRVRYPHSDEEEKVADLLLGEEQGRLLYLKGSDSDYLKRGREDMDKLIKDHPSNPLTVYAKFIKGFNVARSYKKILADGKIKAREPHVREAESLLGSVFKLSKEGKGLDNISLNQTMRQLAKSQKIEHGEEEAKKTMDQLLQYFRGRKFKHNVMETIEQQAKQTLS